MEPSAEENKKPSMPDVLQYTNYRVFLHDYYAYKKSTSAVFSLRFFAAKAGLSSHAHLKLVMDGKRNITKNTVVKIIQGLNLADERATYFENLVFFNQAKTDKEKAFYYGKLVKSTPGSRLHKMDQAHFRIFTEWYHSVIREMVELRGFNPAPEWISRRLGGTITPAQAAESLNLLSSLGLISRTANGYSQAQSLITTDDEVSDLLVKQYHRQMLDQAKDSMENVPAEKRDISAVTFAIQRKDFPALKKHLQLMRKELLDFSSESGTGEDVVQVNIQLFPLTRGM
ncbi:MULTISPECIES: TIGR02147 family protein [Hallerella]|uniref:TIGR02147 family protein n=1 Tax=Hallerella TaxID=2815788 RepID=UPI0023EFEE05|nr:MULTISPECIES: TIGR02147 family protein [Hallerella]MCI6872759.1 TIGR02147 family protein [Hallerella sp.]MDD6092302.1 TIGR02147 family protein [Hallerella succinigenes]MDY5028241.1 TIGR02147 family protein [Hallerella succinigenes]